MGLQNIPLPNAPKAPEASAEGYPEGGFDGEAGGETVQASPELTRRELEHARTILDRWPRYYRRELGSLPLRELGLFAQAAALLDCEPCDPDTLELLADTDAKLQQHVDATTRRKPNVAPTAEFLELAGRLGAA